MKKIIAALLCALMLTMACAAYAEPVTLADPAEQFNVTVELGDAISLGDIELIDLASFTQLRFAAHPEMVCSVVIAPTELYTGNLNDMNDDQVREIAELTTADMDSPEWSVQELDNGLMVVTVLDKGEYPMGTVFTVHDGHFVQATFWGNDFAALEGGELDSVLAFFGSMSFVEVQ